MSGASKSSSADDSTPLSVSEELRKLPIVGIGASAGGLEALQQLLQALPERTGMAFVVVQHLAPTFTSLLSTILQRFTKMPVIEVGDEPQVLPNHVYVIPPNRNMIITGGHLRLLPRSEARGQHRPVDWFFRSLAEFASHQGVGVVLSGTGNDGTLGLMAIKTEGGITFAQDESAQQEGMPQSAIAAGCVDFVMPPQQIAQELVRIGQHPYVGGEKPGGNGVHPPVNLDKQLDRILKLIRDVTGTDFTNYKSTTLLRRITRRMLLQKLEGLQEYLGFLQNNPTEVHNLFRDILISVTAFFRDEAALETLKKKVFPKLIQEHSRNDPIRVWVMGCSTGEEPYSLAMAFTEVMSESQTQVPLQIFATDLNEQGIEKARAGIYTKNIAEDMSTERLRRFFEETDSGYRVIKSIREICIFARQNILSDPPFSRMDLITCRNLLIYLEPVLQQKIVPLLHYALKPNGYLWLGSSETIGTFGDLFAVVDSKYKIFVKKQTHPSRPLPVPLTTPAWQPISMSHLQRRFGAGVIPPDLQKEADRLALAKYSPPAVLINADFDILQFRGDTSPFLAAAPGKPSHNALKMAREGLLVGLRSALQQAAKENRPIRQEGLQVRSNGGFQEVHLEAVPIPLKDSEVRHYLVTFESAAQATNKASPASPDPAASEQANQGAERQVAHLTQELAATREYLQSLIEQQEAANEELQSANEEIQSSNEELQSVNEELQTSKEEIQSSNEELTTVNEELLNRNEQLSQSLDDVTNFLSNSYLALVMLDREMRIRRFTPQAEKVLQLHAADIGRLISELNLPVAFPDLEKDLAEVVDTMRMKEYDVQDNKKHWYSLRLRPYKTHENRIEGAVLVLIDIDAQKQDQMAIQASEQRLRLAMEGVGMGTWDMDPASGESVWSESRFHLFGLEPTLGGKTTFSVWMSRIHPDDVARVKEEIERAKQEHKLFTTEHRIIRADNQQIVWLRPFGRFLYNDRGEAVRFLGVSFDDTERKQAVEALRTADRNKDLFLAMLAHELRNPLSPLRNSLEVLRQGTLDGPPKERSAAIMERQVNKLTRLVDDLLDLTRINQGKIALQRHLVDLRDIVPAAAESVEHQIIAQGLKLNISLPSKPIYITADATRMEQVLANLLTNAAKYTEREGSIDVDLQAKGDEAVLRVSDTGVGIKPEELPNIFNLFAQGRENGERSQGGLGIGLSLVRQLAELHGGEVEAASPGPGKGSVFTVRLPLLSPSQVEQARKRSTRDETSPPNLPRQRILIVDDNVDAADSLSDILQLYGHDVRVAYEGQAALEQAREFSPQIILLDIGLPGIDGNEVCRRLLQRPETKKTIIVALTGYGNDDAYYRSKEAGFHSHLLKPVNAQDLLQILAKLAMRAGNRKS